MLLTKLAESGGEQNATNSRLREDRFSTRIKAPHEQFDYWRETIAPLAEVTTRRVCSEGFDVQARAYDLGRVHFASLRTDAMRYRRTNQRIRRSAIDHWQLVLRRRGSEFGAWGERPLRSEAGSVDIRSLAVPGAAAATAGELICVWMSRDNFSYTASLLDAACQQPFTGTMRIVLREFILALDRYKSSLTVCDIPFVTTALTSLIEAAVLPTGDRLAQAARPISAGVFEAARRYIDLNLCSPTLGAEALCRELGVSRRTLYYLFEDRGGLATFIRTRRLESCHRALECASEHRLISTVAYKHGFSDPASFSRAFRAHFGYSPRDARHARADALVPSCEPPKSLTQWLRVKEMDASGNLPLI